MKAFIKRSILIAIMALTIISLPISSIVVRAYTNEEYTIEVTTGIEGKYRMNSYIPVNVSIFSRDTDFDGEVQIKIKNGTHYDAYSKEVYAKAKQIVEVSIPINIIDSTNKFYVELIENGEVIAEKEVIPSEGRVSDTDVFIGVLTDDISALGYIDKFSYEDSSYIAGATKVQINEKLLGENYLNIATLDVIIINNYNMSNLKDSQYKTLKNWVKAGGTLVIGAGANEGKTIKNIESSFIDIKSKGTSEKSIVLENNNLNLIFSDLEINDAKVKSSNGDTPLVYSLEEGKGEILITTFDLGLEPFISSEASTKFINGLLSDCAKGINVNLNNIGIMGNDQYYINNLTQCLPIDEGVNVGILSLIILAYVLIIGIGVYITLKILDKRDLTWIVIPAIAIIFTGIIYLINMPNNLKDIILNQNNIINVDKDGKAVVNGYIGIGTKYKSDLSIKKPEDIYMDYINNNSFDSFIYQDNKEVNVRTIYSGEDSYFEFNNNQALDIKNFEVSNLEIAIPDLDYNFRLNEGNLNGTVKNNLPEDIRKLILVSGNSIWDLGRIEKDEEINISDLEVSTEIGLSAYVRDVLGSNYWNGIDNKSNEELKNINRIVSLLSIAEEEGNENIKLVAITDYPIDYGIEFDKKSISKFDSTILIQDIEIDYRDEEGNYNFPNGYFKTNIEKSDNNIYFDSITNTISGDGEAEFSINIDDNIEVIDFVVKEGELAYSQYIDNNYKIYNYTTGNYDDLNLNNGEQKITKVKDYIKDNIIKIKIVVKQHEMSSIPSITVRGKDR